MRHMKRYQKPVRVFAAFALNAYKNIKNDKEAWGKLFPQKVRSE